MPGDAVGAASYRGAQIAVVLSVFLQRLVTQHHIPQLSHAVGYQQRLQRGAVGQNVRLKSALKAFIESLGDWKNIRTGDRYGEIKMR